MNKIESEITNIIITSNGKLKPDEVEAIIFNQGLIYLYPELTEQERTNILNELDNTITL
jgi:hypothetical protein